MHLVSLVGFDTWRVKIMAWFFWGKIEFFPLQYAIEEGIIFLFNFIIDMIFSISVKGGRLHFFVEILNFHEISKKNDDFKYFFKKK